MTSRFFLLLLPCLVLVGFLGCSTPETRSKEKSDTFARLTQEQQRDVLQGRITEGLSEDAVYIALGKPYKKRSGRFQGKETLSWIYGRLDSYVIPRYRTRYYRGAQGELYSQREYDPITEYRTVETFAVFFEKGQVIGWQEL
ncbi:MAG: hypothetical protein HC904_13680 [Blastochloris sp.]|nr:hypothetical protein [Blastochloris sp.]